MDYLLEAVRKRDLFQWLRLESEAFWHALLFRDRYNYLGIAAAVPPAVHDSLSQHPGALTQVPAASAAFACTGPLARSARGLHVAACAAPEEHRPRILIAQKIDSPKFVPLPL